MSHWFSVKTRFLSDTAIKKAVNEMGYPMRHNTICRGYDGQRKNCDLVISLPGKYDLGFIKQTDGSYLVSADFWNDHISQYLANPIVLEAANRIAEELRNEEKYLEADNLLAEAKMSKFRWRR